MSAFDSLKKMVIEAPILVHYKQDLKIIMKTDSSDNVSSRVFSQLGKYRLLHIIMFFLKNLNFMKYNYEMYDKKLLAIIQYFQQ